MATFFRVVDENESVTLQYLSPERVTLCGSKMIHGLVTVDGACSSQQTVVLAVDGIQGDDRHESRRVGFGLSIDRTCLVALPSRRTLPVLAHVLGETVTVNAMWTRMGAAVAQT